MQVAVYVQNISSKIQDASHVKMQNLQAAQSVYRITIDIHQLAQDASIVHQQSYKANVHYALVLALLQIVHAYFVLVLLILVTVLLVLISIM